jgi:protein TonB
MSIAATFGHALSGSSRSSLHGENKRWAASFALVLTLHAVAAVLILRWYQNLPPPSSAPPAVTMIELAPLPTPPAPAVAVPPPPPEPQVQPQEEPVPVAKPIVQPKPHPLVKRIERPQRQAQPTQTVESTAPVAAPTPPPAQPSVSPQAIPSFSALIAAQLERYKRYPDLAKRRGEQGVVKLRFTLSRSGGVSNAQIEHGSGYADLDNEVLALVQRAQPLPQIPANIPDNTLDIHVPVAFALR